MRKLNLIGKDIISRPAQTLTGTRRLLNSSSEEDDEQREDRNGIQLSSGKNAGRRLLSVKLKRISILHEGYDGTESFVPAEDTGRVNTADLQERRKRSMILRSLKGRREIRDVSAVPDIVSERQIKRSYVKDAIASAARQFTESVSLTAAAVLMITVIFIAGMIISSPFGIFLSGEVPGRSLQSAVNEISTDFLRQLAAIKDDGGYDAMIINGSMAPWEDVLSVYGVLICTDPGNYLDTLTVTEEKEKLLRKIFSDMNRITSRTEGSPGREEGGINRRIVIDIKKMTAAEAAVRYGFSDEQIRLMDELRSAGDDLWRMIGGGYSPGSGAIPSSASVRCIGMFCWPLPEDGYITSRFGYRSDPFSGETLFHGGTDIAAAEGTPVLAAADGTVIVSNGSDSWGGGYGYHVMIDHGGGIVTLYGHCSFVCVTKGQKVRKGEMIAGVGTTGNSTGDHLHFEVRIDGEKTDPLLYFVL